MRETWIHARLIALLLSRSACWPRSCRASSWRAKPRTRRRRPLRMPLETIVLTLDASDPVPVGGDIWLSGDHHRLRRTRDGDHVLLRLGSGRADLRRQHPGRQLGPGHWRRHLHLGALSRPPRRARIAGACPTTLKTAGAAPTARPGPSATIQARPSRSARSRPRARSRATDQPSDEPTDEPPPASESESTDTPTTSTDRRTTAPPRPTPIETGVDWSSGTSTGTTTIAESPAITQTPPSGYTIIGQQVDISAPAGTAAAPLSIRFLLDPAIVPAGQDETTIVVLRNGVPVPDCDPLTSGVADPDPCIYARIRAGDDVAIRVYTSAASHWNFATAPPFDYDFSGFRNLAMPPAVNTAVAGAKVALVFSLGGNQGTDIFAAGSPTSYRADCATWAQLGTEKPSARDAQGTHLQRVE